MSRSLAAEDLHEGGGSERTEFAIRASSVGGTATLFAVAAVVIGVLALWTCDDAYISFRYARHLAEGNGLVFNIGESPPIEGFSNLLWVLVLALFELVGVASTLAAPVLSIAAFAWLARTVATDIGSVTTLGRPRLVAVMFACLLSLPPMVVWSTSGLETMAFALALYQVGRSLTTLGSLRALVFWSICAVSLRVDGGVYLGALFATGLAASLLWPGAVDRKRLVVLLLTAAITIGLIMVFRQLYFGTWSPHTARVKVDPSAIVFDRGSRYIFAMLVGIPGLLLLALLTTGHGTLRLFRSKVSLEKGLIALFGAPFITGLLLSALAGGDFMAFARFFVPAVPFLTVIAALALGGARSREPSLALQIATTAILVLNLLALSDRWALPSGVAERVHFRWNSDDYRSEATVWKGMRDRATEWAYLGRALAEHTQPGETLVRGAIGAVGYYSELYVLDTYGLVDPDVAEREGHPEIHSPGHDRQVPDSYFLDRNPDYFTYTDLVPDSDRTQGIPTELIDQEFLSELFTVEYKQVSELPDTVLRLMRYTGGTADE